MGAPGVINHAQARMQDPAAPTHRLPALGRNIRGVGFSKEFAIELEDRIAANDKTVYLRGKGTFGFTLCQVLRDRYRCGRCHFGDDSLFVHVGAQYLGGKTNIRNDLRARGGC